MQCGSDEPSWSWTQIWVQARMPDYSLNWIAKSSAMQRCQCCSSPTRKRPSRSCGPFGLAWSIDHPAQTVRWKASHQRARSSIIQGVTKELNEAAHPPEGGPAEIRGLSASSLPWSNWLFGTDARQSAEKPLHKAEAVGLMSPPQSNWLNSKNIACKSVHLNLNLIKRNIKKKRRNHYVFEIEYRFLGFWGENNKCYAIFPR